MRQGHGCHWPAPTVTTAMLIPGARGLPSSRLWVWAHLGGVGGRQPYKLKHWTHGVLGAGWGLRRRGSDGKGQGAGPIAEVRVSRGRLGSREVSYSLQRTPCGWHTVGVQELVVELTSGWRGAWVQSLIRARAISRGPSAVPAGAGVTWISATMRAERSGKVNTEPEAERGLHPGVWEGGGR